MMKLKPPEDYASWLHYAIATMDTRSVHLDSITSDHWGRVVQRHEMIEAAEAELSQLEEVYINQQLQTSTPAKNIRRCKKCGARILDGTNVCGLCTEVFKD